MQSRIKVRVVCARAYHALFMHNMMIRPSEQELASFGKPDFTIFNAGAFPVNRYTSYMSSSTSVDVNLRCALPQIPSCWGLQGHVAPSSAQPYLCKPL